MKDFHDDLDGCTAFVVMIFILAFWKACEIIWFLFNHVSITLK